MTNCIVKYLKAYLILLFLVLVHFCDCSVLAASQTQIFNHIEIGNLSSLPDTDIGLSGCFVGVSNGVLIVAGGTNFPDEMPWNGGKKVWYDDIYVLKKNAGGNYEWLDKRWRMPQKAAYGASVNLAGGILCVGGCDESKCLSDVYLVSWNPHSSEIEIKQYPSLPEPLMYIAGASARGSVYIAGGQGSVEDPVSKSSFYRLDVSVDIPKWQAQTSWPGRSRKLAILASQTDGTKDCVYLFGGQHYSGDVPIFLDDGFRYEAEIDKWCKVSDMPSAVVGASYLSYGVNILVFGGDDGVETLKRIELNKRIMSSGSDVEKQTLDNEYKLMFENHPGFSGGILAYNAIVDRWVSLGEYESFAVTTTAVNLDGRIVIAAGEMHPGIRTSGVKVLEIKNKGSFGVLNYFVLTVYFFGLVLMGFYFSKRENTTEDFFLGGRRVPWWAAGLSIFGTQLSAITFMAIPAKTFASDWLYLPTIIGALLLTPVITKAFLPFYRRLNVTSAYEYLEFRFGLPIRLIGSMMFVVMQLGRLGIVLLLPSLTLYVVTGMNVFACIILMGVMATIYTVLGGIEAVIWTDVVQVVVLIAGAVICFTVMVFSIDGGVSEIISTGIDAGKFNVIDWDMSLTKVTIAVLVLAALGGIAGPYASDQSVIQRYLTTKDEKSAAKGIWTNAILCIPTSILFYSLGSALYAFYKYHPAKMSVAAAGIDTVLPAFIIQELPAGVSGLVIAGIFAASMSSLDSSMNSVATVGVTDFYRRLFRNVTEQKCLKLAKIITAVMGAAGTGFALLMATTDIKSLWDQFTVIIGLFGAGLGGLFVLGIFTKRANVYGAAAGFAFSCVVQYYVSRHTSLHFFLYTFTGLVSCVSIGFLVSLFFAQNKNLQGLTIYTQNKIHKVDN